MRTPVAHTSRQDPQLTEELANGLAALLVAEYRRRQVQHSQPVGGLTVASPRRHNHTDDESADETNGGGAR